MFFRQALNELSVDVGLLATSLHGFFKHSTIRREQFSWELIDLDLPQHSFLRHVESRWLSLKPAAERIDKNWAAIESYFLKQLPEKAKEGDRTAKDAMKMKYYSMITEILKKPMARLMLKQVIFLCDLFYPFILTLQSEAPQIHNMHDTCYKLLFEVMMCFLKKECLPTGMTAKQLLKVDLGRNTKEIPKMSPSAYDCFKKLSSNSQTVAKKEIFAMFKKAAAYLIGNLHPLDSSLIRHLRALDPEVRADMADGGAQSIVSAAREIGHLSSGEVDSLALQWTSLSSEAPPKKAGERIDTYYSRVLADLDARQPHRDFKELGKFIHQAVSIPTSNALVERGFNLSKQMVDSREKVSLETLCAERVIKEAVTFYGGPENVPITPALVAHHVNARQVYRTRLEKEQREKKEHEADVQADKEKLRQKQAQEERRAQYNDKKRKLEEEEKTLREELKYDEAVLKEREKAAETTQDAVEMRSAVSHAKQLRQAVAQKREKLDRVLSKKIKLMESHIPK